MAYRVPGGRPLPSLNLGEPAVPVSTSSGGLRGVTPSKVDDNAGRLKRRNALEEKLLGNTGDVLAQDKANALSGFAAKKFNGTKDQAGLLHMEGDPTRRFEDFDKELDATTSELMSSVEDAHPIVQEKVLGQLSKTYQKIYAKRTVVSGAKFNDFDAKTTQARVDNLIEQISDTYVLEGMAGMEKDLDEITTILVKRAGRSGLLKVGEGKEGEPPDISKSPQLTTRVGEAHSKALVGVIQIQVAERNFDGAEEILNEYSEVLSNAKEASFRKEIKKERREAQALDFTKGLRGLPREEARKRIDKIKDPQIREKVENFYTQDVLQAKKVKEAFSGDMMTNWYMKIVQPNSPYKTFSDVLNDPRFRMDRQKMTTYHQKTIQGLFKTKKSTNYRSADKLLSILDNDKLSEVSRREAIELTADVEPRIARQFMKQWEIDNNPQTKPQIRSSNRYLSQTLTELYRSMFRPGQKLTEIDEKNLTQMRTLLFLEEDLRLKEPAEMRSHVTEFLRFWKENKVKEKGWIYDDLFSVDEVYNQFRGNIDKPVTQVPDRLLIPSQKALGGGGGIPSESKSQILREFRREKGKAPSNQKELLDFYNERGDRSPQGSVRPILEISDTRDLLSERIERSKEFKIEERVISKEFEKDKFTGLFESTNQRPPKDEAELNNFINEWKGTVDRSPQFLKTFQEQGEKNKSKLNHDIARNFIKSEGVSFPFKNAGEEKKFTEKFQAHLNKVSVSPMDIVKSTERFFIEKGRMPNSYSELLNYSSSLYAGAFKIFLLRNRRLPKDASEVEKIIKEFESKPKAK